MVLNLSGLSDPKLVELLNNGSVGVMPSDTIYGVMCRAADEVAVGRLYSLKSREGKPGTVIAASAEQLIELGVPARYIKAVSHFWPNSISIILPTTPELSYLDFGKNLAMRVPENEELNMLLQKTGPLLTSSANQPGEPPSSTVEEAKKYFGDEVDFYVDGGNLSGRPPSTIIKIIDDEIDVIREGAIKLNEFGEVVK